MATATLSVALFCPSSAIQPQSRDSCKFQQRSVGTLFSTERSSGANSLRGFGNRGRVRCAAEAESAGTAVEVKPQITLRFLKPDGGEERTVTVGSGEKQLRRFMLEEKIPLYSFVGKVTNCGGAGNCGTCLVQIKEGAELLSGRTEAEEKMLKKKPSDWRLACQTIIGDKSNSGEVVVQTIPQKKG